MTRFEFIFLAPLSSPDPPTFNESQFDIILRRQRVRPSTRPFLKSTAVPSRFINLPNDFEFAGWGTLLNLTLDHEDYAAGKALVEKKDAIRILGQFTASALAGNFYALPAVVGVASVYLNISGKSLALLGAALLFLDFASTSVVSAATAATYLSGEVILPFPGFVGSILVLSIFTLVSLSGIKESARVALCVLSLHLASMTVLIVAAVVHWAEIGNNQIIQNWHDGKARTASEVAKHIFNGFCLGMLGLTGFECIPAYIARIKPGRLPLVLRNLHYPAIVLNCVLMTLVLAILPLEIILEGNNVLSLLAEKSVNKALRIFIAFDAIIVLCGGVLTGILSACELLDQLALDRLIPGIFTNVMPLTKAPYVSILSFIAFGGVIYASTGARLNIVSKIGRLPRTHITPLWIVLLALLLVPVIFVGNVVVDPTTVGWLIVVLLVRYFAIYLVAIVAFFSATQNKTHILRCVYWLYDQFPSLHRWKLTESWGGALIKFVVTLKRQPVCILVKSDEVSPAFGRSTGLNIPSDPSLQIGNLFHMISYVRDNEETSCVKIVHFVDEEGGVPSELEANAKSEPKLDVAHYNGRALTFVTVLDEAFPEITIDLVSDSPRWLKTMVVIEVSLQIIVHGTLNRVTIAALGHRIKIPPSLMMMSCPGPNFEHNVADLGTRIVTL
ncbi:hypothetical protein D9757_006168 [Collybiopsis confluens]|uniref:Uncharacterized protein n=1 Tax=Collybiopsis confluens TaxID=2823264 RepID=A0A8H5M7H6_9AGAR|nr:hypothetical protein D9757_006168 [Collybiopsis confluens]